VLARVPSPQELVYHTQAIMQNALIKKQLEDQKERFMKKQQQDCQSKSPNPIMMANAGGIGNVSISVPLPVPVLPAPIAMPAEMSVCQTRTQPNVSTPTSTKAPPTAFTPTSVIIKMASDKAGKDKGGAAEVAGSHF
jgi:translation initiation factor 4E transporter